MQSKILFWLALTMAFMGMHSSEGHLFYFFTVYLSMLLIGCWLHGSEKRLRKNVMAGPSSSRPAAAKAKTA